MTIRPKLRHLAGAALALAIGLMIASTASAAVNQLDPNQWNPHIPGRVQASTYGADYGLANLRTTTYLVAHHRTFGAGLDWGDGTHVSTGLRHWSFKRHSGASGAIVPSETVALYDNFTHQYLVRADQHFGIDLGFTGTPRYEWRVTAVNGHLSLWNTREADYLVSAPRTIGVDLIWLEQLRRQVGGPSPTFHTTSVALHATGRDVMGYTPRAGTLGGDPSPIPGTIQAISNPTPDVITLLEPGYTTAWCWQGASGRASGPGIIRLPPGATLSAQERLALFDSTNPALPITFNACTEGQLSMTSFSLTVSYFGLPDPNATPPMGVVPSA